jgi:hypothetical protein
MPSKTGKIAFYGAFVGWWQCRTRYARPTKIQNDLGNPLYDQRLSSILTGEQFEIAIEQTE